MENGCKVLNMNDKMFIYKNKRFTYVFANDEIYFKGKEVAEFLEYTDTNKALRNHVDDDEKEILQKINPAILAGLKGNEKNTIYITESGLYSLVLGSKKKEAKEFKKFVCKEILPSIRKNGEYSIHKPSQLILDTSFLRSFYVEQSVANYVDLNVVYLGVIGVYNKGFLMKYGMSSRVFERDFDEHKKTFGDQFKIISIIETDNNREVEELFEKVIKSKRIDTKMSFNNKLRKELFVTNDMFTLDDAVKELERIALANPLRSLKNKENEIKELQFKYDNNLLMEQEKTKQTQLELEKEKEKTKQLELEIKLFEMKGEHKRSKDKDEESNNDKLEDDNVHILKKYNEANKGDVNKILESLFKYTGRHEDVILNKDLDMISCKTNIKKSSMIAYLRSLGSTKYKCSSISGHRKVSLTKYAKGKYIK